jgi:hypothetical protein
MQHAMKFFARVQFFLAIAIREFDRGHSGTLHSGATTLMQRVLSVEINQWVARRKAIQTEETPVSRNYVPLVRFHHRLLYSFSALAPTDKPPS